MASEYFKMKNHNYTRLDDYHHCKANYNAADRGPLGILVAKTLGDLKEHIDYYKNIWYNGLSPQEALVDKRHDQNVNAEGILRQLSGEYQNAVDACAHYRLKNPEFPKKYWQVRTLENAIYQSDDLVFYYFMFMLVGL